MAEALEALHFVFVISAVVDSEIDVPHHFQRDGVVGTGRVLDIVDQRDGTALILDAIADRATRVVQHEGLDPDAWMRFQDLPGVKIAEAHRRLADVGLHREPWRADELLDHFARGHLAIEMAGPDAQIDRRIVDGLEERQPDDVVIVTVAEEQIDVANLLVEHAKPRLAGAGARVEDHTVFATANFDAGGVATIAIELRPGDRDTAAHAPELYLKEIFTHRFFKMVRPTALP